VLDEHQFGVTVALQAHRDGALSTERLSVVLAHYDDSSAAATPVDQLLARLGGMRLEDVERAVAATGLPASDGRPRAFGARLTILETLGRGAMGVVYKAFDRILKRVVALKVVGDTASSERRRLLLARFEREAQVLARLRHPSVVPIFDVGIAPDGCPYLVMDFVAGRTLEAIASDSPGHLEAGRVAAWGAALADALHACHEVGVVHRDVKPSNVMIDDSGVPRLVDFGVARDADSNTRITQEDAMVGTISYMAPEQARGEPASPLSDIWSLGATLFDALAGRPPFEGAHPLMVLDGILHGPLPDLRSIRSDVPTGLAAAIQKCLSRDPAKRFPSGAALASELRRTLARPVRRPTRARPGPLVVGAATISMGAGFLAAIALTQRDRRDPILQMNAPSPVASVTPTEPAKPPPARRYVLLDDGHAVTTVGEIQLVWVAQGLAALGPPRGQRPAEDDPDPREVRFERGYWIGAVEVTRAQYSSFCEATGAAMPSGSLRLGERVHAQSGDEPIAFVSWSDAEAFCAWVGGRLPTGNEWEYAARGTDGRRWPWGNAWPNRPPMANVADASVSRLTTPAPFPIATRLDDEFPFTSPVGSFPLDRSASGCLDMAGNVGEWTSDPAADPRLGHSFRGGTFNFTDWGARPWAPHAVAAGEGSGADCVGIRVLLDE